MQVYYFSGFAYIRIYALGIAVFPNLITNNKNKSFSFRMVDRYLLGSKELLVTEILISNFGEDAFEAGFYMNVPTGLDFNKIERIGDIKDTPITCTAPTLATNNTLKCDIGNPLSMGKVAHFKVIMKPAQKAGMAPSYDFFMEANSTNPEKDGSSFDNVAKRNVKIWVETDLTISGTALPAEFHYNSSQYGDIENITLEHQLGPQVVTIYNIRNNGPSSIEQAEVVIIWSHQTNDGDALMYLLNHPETHGNIKCDPSNYINSRELLLDTQLSRKSYLESSGAIIKSNSHGGKSSLHGSGVYVQQSTGRTSSGSSSNSESKIRFSEAEKKKLDAEDEIESVGDGSHMHRQSGSGQSYTSSSNYSRSGANGPVTYYSSHNRSSIRGPEETYRAGFASSSNSDRSGENALRRQQASNSQSAFQQQRQQTSQNKYGESGSRARNEEHNIAMNAQMNQNNQQKANYNANVNVNSNANSQAGSGTTRRRMYSQQDGEPFRAGLITGAKVSENGFAAKDGFRTSTLDLGTLGRDNVDEEMRNRGSHMSSSSSSHGSSSGSSHGSSGGQRQSSHGNSGNNFYSSGQAVGGGQGQGHGQSSSSSYSSGSSSGSQQNSNKNVNTDNTIDYNEEDIDYEDEIDQQSGHQSKPVNDQFKHYRRFRRDVSDNIELEKAFAHHCNGTRCGFIRCVVGPLVGEDDTWIALRMRLVAKTMRKLAPNNPMKLSTMTLARVTKLPFIGEDPDPELKSHEVVITATPEPIIKPDVVPLYVVVLSACAGAIILLLIIYLLHKVRIFFVLLSVFFLNMGAAQNSKA